MKDTEILQQVKELFQSGSYEDVSVSLKKDDDYICLTISQMYDYVNVDFAILEKLSHIFNTKKINIGSKHFINGCETCNYGSEYSVEIYLKQE